MIDNVRGGFTNWFWDAFYLEGVWWLFGTWMLYAGTVSITHGNWLETGTRLLLACISALRIGNNRRRKSRAAMLTGTPNGRAIGPGGARTIRVELAPVPHVVRNQARQARGSNDNRRRSGWWPEQVAYAEVAPAVAED